MNSEQQLLRERAVLELKKWLVEQIYRREQFHSRLSESAVYRAPVFVLNLKAVVWCKCPSFRLQDCIFYPSLNGPNPKIVWLFVHFC